MTRRLAWASLAVLALASSGTEAQDYRRTLVPGRPFCVVWPGREFLYRLDPAGSARTPGDSEFAAIDASVASWRAVSNTCSDYVFTRGPDLPNPQVGYDKDGGPNDNVITFREQDCNDAVPPGDPCIEADTCANVYGCWEHGNATIGLTTTTFSFRTGYILDADIELNASRVGRGYEFTTADSPLCDSERTTACVGMDLQNTVTHELGHVVGLDHVPEVPGSTMEPTAHPGETNKRIIDVGSAAGFCDAYPRGLPPVQCGENPQLGRDFQAVTKGVASGCGAGPGVLLPLASGLTVMAWRRRRQGPGAPRG